MDELKILVEMVASLPTMAVWVLLGFFVYKTIVVGSIYGVIRFVTKELMIYLSLRKTREIEYKEIRPMIDAICIHTQTDHLIAQLNRLKGKGVNIKTDYIHSQSVEWLKEAIDDKITKETLSTTV